MFKVHGRKAAYQALYAKHVDLSTDSPWCIATLGNEAYLQASQDRDLALRSGGDLLFNSIHWPQRGGSRIRSLVEVNRAGVTKRGWHTRTFATRFLNGQPGLTWMKRLHH